jgi:hypothetical protein
VGGGKSPDLGAGAEGAARAAGEPAKTPCAGPALPARPTGPAAAAAAPPGSPLLACPARLDRLTRVERLISGFLFMVV